MNTNPRQSCAWESSLTYLISRVSPLMAKSIEQRMCRKLSIECRHLGLLNYLEDSGGAVQLGPAAKRNRRAPAPATTLEIIQLFGELFWGPQTEQKQPDLQVQALLGPLEEQGLVVRIFDQSQASRPMTLSLTTKGRATRKRAMKLVQETEMEFFAHFSSLLPESLTRGLLELREELLKNCP